MNLPPRQIRRIAGFTLAAVAVGVAGWSFADSVASFRQREKDAQGAASQLQQRIDSARAVIQEVRKLELDSEETRRQIARLGQHLPEGAAAAWMPELLKKHFAAFGLDASTVRMNTVREEKDLPGFGRGYWSVGLPLREAGGQAEGSLFAAAELELQHPWVRVLDFAIRPDPENPKGRIALLNVAALIRK